MNDLMKLLLNGFICGYTFCCETNNLARSVDEIVEEAYDFVHDYPYNPPTRDEVEEYVKEKLSHGSVSYKM